MTLMIVDMITGEIKSLVFLFMNYLSSFPVNVNLATVSYGLRVPKVFNIDLRESIRQYWEGLEIDQVSIVVETYSVIVICLIFQARIWSAKVLGMIFLK